MKDLVEYRSHLARHQAEGDFDLEETSNLKDDTAIVVSDWKMKILLCFFRENQAKWFGKRGTSCLGFMIISNSRDQKVAAQGLKKVQFVMMFTDDTKQDGHSVACAKAAEVYRKYLPSGVDKVIFQSNGAGCFKSVYHQAIQPLWKGWTGVEETVYRITPAGDGKSCLDGMFGRMNSIMSSSVDCRLSYKDADSSLEAVEYLGDVSSTKFLTCKPDRSNQLYVSITGNTFKGGGVLCTELNTHTRQIFTFQHSGYGQGAIVNQSQAHFSLTVKPTAKMIQTGTNTVIPSFALDHRGIRAMIAKNLRSFGEKNAGSQLDHKLDVICGEIEAASFHSFVVTSMSRLMPATMNVVVGQNKMEHCQSYASIGTEGGNHPHVRQKREANQEQSK